MNLADLKHFTDRRWDEDLVPRLVEYVKVPAKSPGFDASWAAHGHLQAVVKEAHAWAAAQKIKGLNLEIVALEGKTPCIFFDVPATGTFGNAKTVLFYGHLDKQPEMVGWREGLGPWKPVVEDGKLYGRGSADDGYAIYAALTIVAALDAQGTPRPRCVGIIETCEESGSPDLPAYLDLLAPRFGDVALVAGLDSGCGNYEQLWVTTSLRGLVGGTMTVEVLTEGVHSGKASGLVPSSMRIARQLLNRIDDPATGRVVDPVFHADIPAERLQQAQKAGDPFHPDNVTRLRVVAVGLAWLELVRYAVWTLGALLPPQAAPDRPNLSLTAWFSILVVVVLAEVFREGARLRRESELTI